MREVLLLQLLVQGYNVLELDLRQRGALRVHPMLVALHLVAHEELNRALSGFPGVLQEAQDLLEASMQVSQGLNLVLQAPVFYHLEVLVDLDAGLSIEGGLFDAPSDLQDEILLAARGGEHFHLILNVLERVLVGGKELPLLEILQDVHFHPTEIVHDLLSVSIGQGVHGKSLYHQRVIDGEAHNVVWLDPLNGVLVSVQHVLRLKLLLLRIFVKDFS